MSRTRALAIAALLAPLGTLGCNDSASPLFPAHPGDGPRLTLGSGTVNTPLVRANAGSFDVQSDHNGYEVELKTRNNTDIVVVSSTASPGGHTGWHSHPGPVIIAVRAGTLITYDADDPNCLPKVHPAGTAFLEHGGGAHMARNEGSVNAEWVATLFVPPGAPTRLDAPDPGHCPF